MRMAILLALFLGGNFLVACDFAPDNDPSYNTGDTIISDGTNVTTTDVNSDTLQTTANDTQVPQDTTTPTDTVLQLDTYLADTGPGDTTTTADTSEETFDTQMTDTSSTEDSSSYEDTQVTDTSSEEDSYTGPVGPCPKEFQPGDLLHTSIPAGDAYIYLLDKNSERMMIPQLGIFNSWYSDFLGVNSVPVECLTLYPLRSQGPVLVGYRPGSRIIQDPVAPQTYVILPGSLIAEVNSEELIKSIYGDSWHNRLVVVDDVTLANYMVTDPITEPLPHDGMLVRNRDMLQDERVWYVKDGQLVEILDGAGFWQNDVVATPEATLNQMPVSTETMTLEDVINELREQL